MEERFTDAYVLLEFCHALKPDDGTTTGFLGVIHKGIGNYARALLLFKNAFESDPYDQWFRYSKMLMEMETQKGANHR